MPVERSLVERFQGQPLVIVGINADHERQDAKRIGDREGITWRSWWDGGDTGSPLAKQCGVQRWPTLFVLDGQGIVRFAHLSGPQLEKAVTYLLREKRRLESKRQVASDRRF